METAIRKGKAPFYASDVFPYGLSRSSYFNKRESQYLIDYGHTLSGLHKGILTPENAEEVEFIEALNTDCETSLYSVRLWKKYLYVAG